MGKLWLHNGCQIFSRGESEKYRCEELVGFLLFIFLIVEKVARLVGKVRVKMCHFLEL